jgi:hypothetical protein
MAGTTTGRAGGGGFAIGDDGIIPVFGGGRVKTQTDLARSVAPPKPMEDWSAWFVIGGVVAAMVLLIMCFNAKLPKAASILTGATALTLGLVGAVTFSRRVKTFNSTIHRRALETWKTLWICHRCGFRFLPGQATRPVDVESPEDANEDLDETLAKRLGPPTRGKKP